MLIPIVLNSTGKGLHMGRQAGYERFVGSYFEKINETENNFIDKAIINSIKYNPDKIYGETDGYVGTCWSVDIIDPDDNTKWATGISSYSFRNFQDLVAHYELRGYKFVDCYRNK